MCLKCIRVFFRCWRKAVEVDILLTVALHLLALFSSLIYALSLFTTISAGEQFSHALLLCASAVECQNVFSSLKNASSDVVWKLNQSFTNFLLLSQQKNVAELMEKYFGSLEEWKSFLLTHMHNSKAGGQHLRNFFSSRFSLNFPAAHDVKNCC